VQHQPETEESPSEMSTIVTLAAEGGYQVFE